MGCICTSNTLQPNAAHTLTHQPNKTTHKHNQINWLGFSLWCDCHPPPIPAFERCAIHWNARVWRIFDFARSSSSNSNNSSQPASDRLRLTLLLGLCVICEQHTTTKKVLNAKNPLAPPPPRCGWLAYHIQFGGADRCGALRRWQSVNGRGFAYSRRRNDLVFGYRSCCIVAGRSFPFRVDFFVFGYTIRAGATISHRGDRSNCVCVYNGSPRNRW